MLRSRAVVVWPGVGQAFRVLVARVLHAERLGLLVHEFDEMLDRAAHAFGQRHGGVVARLHDQALDQVFDRHLHLRVDEHARAGHLPGARADRQGLLQGDLLGLERVEHQVGRHQLGQRGRLDRAVDVLLRQHLVGRDVEQQVAARRDLRAAPGTWAPTARQKDAARRGSERAQRFEKTIHGRVRERREKTSPRADGGRRDS